MVIGISLSLAQSDLFKQLSLQYANLLFDKIVSFLRFNNTLKCLTKRQVSIWWVCRWGFDAFWETSPSGWILCLSTVNENWPKTSNYSRSHYFGLSVFLFLSRYGSRLIMKNHNSFEDMFIFRYFWLKISGQLLMSTSKGSERATKGFFLEQK